MSRSTQRKARVLLAGLAASTLLACAAAPPPPPPPAPPPPRAPTKLRVQSELGEIDEDATKKAFAHARPALLDCYASGLERVEAMAGEVKFFMRVKADGHLRWAFFEVTTLGDRTTERCMLDALNAAAWPLPEGGEAEVHQGLEFDPPQGAKPPVEWGADKLAAPLAKRADELRACKRHGDATYQVTAYVKADHGAGRVLAAGASSSTQAASADVDCLLGIVASMKVTSPGSSVAKVSFSP